MPEISRFYGIIIFMYIKDHNPPHFMQNITNFKQRFLLKILHY